MTTDQLTPGLNATRLIDLIAQVDAAPIGSPFCAALAIHAMDANPTEMREIAAFLACRSNIKDQTINRLDGEIAPLGRHRDSIRIMRRTLTRLAWWQWRRRRNIQFQLAQIALALGE